MSAFGTALYFWNMHLGRTAAKRLVPLILFEEYIFVIFQETHTLHPTPKIGGYRPLSTKATTHKNDEMWV